MVDPRIKQIKSLKRSLTSHIIIKMLNKNKKEIMKYKVRKIGLFGSFLKKSNHKTSDIDLLVKFDKPSFDNYMDLKIFLEKLFHKKVDLVVEDNLKPALEYVKREAIYVK